jgi:hypothetical protein
MNALRHKSPVPRYARINALDGPLIALALVCSLCPLCQPSPAEQLANGLDYLFVLRLAQSGSRDENRVEPASQYGRMRAAGFTESPLYPVSSDRAAQLLADGKPDPRCGLRRTAIENH